MKHVAKIVGVPISTVSRALNPASDHPCPRDVSVTEFNDMSMVDRLIPRLATVRI